VEARKETPAKESRLNIRASARQKSVLKKAARIQQTTMSDFILQNAVKAAQEVIAKKELPDQTHFVLQKKEWDAFCAALDRPPKAIPALRKLLTEPSILDD
jgi:uncharacterized protein (DUF1778 family)